MGTRRELVEQQLRSTAIEEKARLLLLEMYCATEMEGVAVGETMISVAQGAEINKAMRQIGARRSLEVGFAFGFSTIWMLDALPADGLHQAIDPFEKSDWRGVGLKQVERLKSAAKFEWLESRSVQALPRLMADDALVDFVYIDGNHRFDDVLVDFYLADQVLRPGGIIAFDDLWLPSIRTAVSFVESNRQYERMAQPVANLALMRKVADDSRDWRHFQPFEVHQPFKSTGPRAAMARAARQLGVLEGVRGLRDFLRRYHVL